MIEFDPTEFRCPDPSVEEDEEDSFVAEGVFESVRCFPVSPAVRVPLGVLDKSVHPGIINYYFLDVVDKSCNGQENFIQHVIPQGYTCPWCLGIPVGIANGTQWNAAISLSSRRGMLTLKRLGTVVAKSWLAMTHVQAFIDHSSS